MNNLINTFIGSCRYSLSAAFSNSSQLSTNTMLFIWSETLTFLITAPPSSFQSSQILILLEQMSSYSYSPEITSSQYHLLSVCLRPCIDTASNSDDSDPILSATSLAVSPCLLMMLWSISGWNSSSSRVSLLLLWQARCSGVCPPAVVMLTGINLRYSDIVIGLKHYGIED